jgi:pilus assembly protein CpaC
VIVVTPYLVKPVDANQIVLPTDGFRTPDDLQRILGHMDSDGVSDKDRPKPQAAPATAGEPGIGAADPLPTPNRKTKASARTADAAGPGFATKF